MGSALRVGLEQVDLPVPITKNFERYVLQQHARGKVMLGFTHQGGGQFQVYFGEIGDIGLQEQLDLMNIEVAPWRLYIFNQVPSGIIRSGSVFYSVRLVEDYAELLQIGDPLELVNISTDAVLGTGSVVGLHKFRLGDMAAMNLRDEHYPHIQTVEDLRRLLERKYEQEVSMEDTVVLISVRAAEDIHFGSDGVDTARRHQPQRATAVQRFMQWVNRRK